MSEGGGGEDVRKGGKVGEWGKERGKGSVGGRFLGGGFKNGGSEDGMMWKLSLKVRPHRRGTQNLQAACMTSRAVCYRRWHLSVVRWISGFVHGDGVRIDRFFR